MFGLMTKRKAQALAVQAVNAALSHAEGGMRQGLKHVAGQVQAERDTLQARAEAAEAKCAALERRLDGWVAPSEACALRWRIESLEAQVVEIRSAASVYRAERDALREQLAEIMGATDAAMVATFAPGQPVSFGQASASGGKSA